MGGPGSVKLKSLAGAWKADLGPRRHAMAESIRLKAILRIPSVPIPIDLTYSNRQYTVYM